MERMEKREINICITEDEYELLKNKSIFNNTDIKNYIINKALDKKLRNSDEEKRTELIMARITPSELKQLENKVEKLKTTMSEYIRRSVLESEIVVVEDLKPFTKELQGIGRNLNQLTILAHQGKVTSLNLTDIEKRLNSIWKLFNLLVTQKR